MNSTLNFIVTLLTLIFCYIYLGSHFEDNRGVRKWIGKGLQGMAAVGTILLVATEVGIC